jgi:type I restriction enzyme M protein
MPSSSITREALDQHLWAATDILRGSVDTSDSKSYILGLLLLKRLSDRFAEECEIVRSEGQDPDNPDEHEFFVPPAARWEHLRAVPTNVGDALNRATAALENANFRLEGVLNSIDYNDERRLGSSRQRDEILGHLVWHFSRIDLCNANLAEPDLLGRAYEYLIQRFAEESGPRGEDFHTPQDLGRLMVEILQPREGMRVCDPTCGSGGLLVQCTKYLTYQGRDARNLSLFGQEKNLVNWSLCKMNLILHGILDAQIALGDTIRNPRLLEDGNLMLFDLVIGNPPASLDNWGHEAAEYDPWNRFSFGVPPKTRGDFSFLQHMIATLGPQGKMATLIPQGVLFRGGREADIRRKLIESDLIEAVISLPAGILSSTSAPPALLVVNRAKTPSKKGRIFFVDASKTLENTGRPRRGAVPADLGEIKEIVHGFREQDGVSKAVTLDEIENHNFNLRPSIYLGKPPLGERLDRIAEVLQSRGRPTSTSPPTEEVPILQGRDLGARGLTVDELDRGPAYLSGPVFVVEGDVVLQRIGQKPKAMLAGRALVGVLASDTVFVIRLRDEHRSKGAYLTGFLNSPAGQKQMDSSRPHAVIPTLSLRVVRGLRVPLPDPRLTELLERIRLLEDDLFDRVERTLAIRSKIFEPHDAATLDAEMRRLSLEAELLRESLVRAEDLDFQIRNFYPHMVAFGYRRLSSISNPERRFRQQLALLDTILVFLGSIGLAMAIYTANAAELAECRLTRDFIASMWERGVSLGNWVAVCRNAAKALKAKAALASPAGNAFASMWNSRVERTLGNLVKMRNDDVHRRKQWSARDFVSASQGLEKGLQEILKESLFFVRHPIRLVEGHSIPWRAEGAIHQTLVYSGDHPSLRREEIWYPKALSEGHLYLELEPGSWLSLYPLLTVEERSGERQTYAVDRFDAKSVQVGLAGLETGQEASQEHSRRVGEDLRRWFNEIFGSIGLFC